MKWEWKGLWDYQPALEAQRRRRESRMRGEVEDILWLLEHPPVITTGRRNVLIQSVPEGWSLHQTERGGLATCHEPGQLVGYLLMDASPFGPKRLVHAIEEGLIRWLEGHHLLAGRRPEFPGVWIGSQKIAAVGLHLERGFTLHGFALNLCNDLAGFRLIVPCGIVDGGVTTFEQSTGLRLSPEEAAPSVAEAVLQALDAQRSIR